MKRREGPLRDLAAALAGAALVGALVAAGWSVYRALPEDTTPLGRARRGGATSLRIVLRLAPGEMPEGATLAVPVKLYTVNVETARGEYRTERRPGVRFEDFLVERMGGRQPVAAQLDERGEATVTVPHGRWWVHAALAGDEEVTWHMPVNVSGREKTVELNASNVYMRSKSF
ncbi:MAG TPA: hypothetical protein VER32_09640 [Pyrinomonadaceae bacterium]|nr:hypothetical protein [Pyrinomonadaceae bacterium]